MSTPSLEAFFSGGGGRSVSWKDRPIGSTVTGVIEAVHPPVQVTDPVTQERKFKKNGEPIMQVRVDLATDFRNWEMCRTPDDPNETDDGSRSLYVGGWMTGAIGDALKKAGRKGPPEIGAKLSVTLTDRTPNENPAVNPTNKFEASYASPSAVSTGEFFDASAKKEDPWGKAPTGVPRPDSISEKAWESMDETTRKTVAASVGGPPF